MSFKQKIFYGFKTIILSASLALSAYADDGSSSASLLERSQDSVKESTHSFHKLHDDFLFGTKVMAAAHSWTVLNETLVILRQGSVNDYFFGNLHRESDGLHLLREIISAYSFTEIGNRLYEPIQDTSTADIALHALNFLNLYSQVEQWQSIGDLRENTLVSRDMMGDVLSFMAINDILINDPQKTVAATPHSGTMRTLFWAVTGGIGFLTKAPYNNNNGNVKYLSSLLLLDDRLFGQYGSVLQHLSASIK